MSNRIVASRIMEKVASRRNQESQLEGMLKEAYEVGVGDGMQKEGARGDVVLRAASQLKGLNRRGYITGNMKLPGHMSASLPQWIDHVTKRVPSDVRTLQRGRIGTPGWRNLEELRSRVAALPANFRKEHTTLFGPIKKKWGEAYSPAEELADQGGRIRQIRQSPAVKEVMSLRSTLAKALVDARNKKGLIGPK